LSPETEKSVSDQLIPAMLIACKYSNTPGEVSSPCFHALNRTIIRLLIKVADQVHEQSMVERLRMFADIKGDICRTGTLERSCHFVPNAKPEQATTSTADYYDHPPS